MSQVALRPFLTSPEKSFLTSEDCPKEVLGHIFSFLEASQLAHLAEVCRVFYAIVTSEECEDAWIHALTDRFDIPRPFPETPYTLYSQKMSQLIPVKQNMIDGRYTLTYFSEGTQPVVSLIWHHGQLISGSWDMIKRWNIETRKCVSTLDSGVASLAMYGNILINGLHNGAIKGWDLETGECIFTLHEERQENAHADSILSLAVEGHFLISDSKDGTIKIWDLRTKTCTQTWNAHSGHVHSFAVYRGSVIRGELDGAIKMWNLQTGALEHTFTGHRSLVAAVLVDKDRNFLIGGDDDGKIRIWNLETRECVRAFQGHACYVHSFLIHQNFLVSVGVNSIKIWDLDAVRNLQNNPHARILQPHVRSLEIDFENERDLMQISNCHCISMHNGLLMAGSSQGTIKMWDFTQVEEQDAISPIDEEEDIDTDVAALATVMDISAFSLEDLLLFLGIVVFLLVMVALFL